jgi:hypothetical protein
MRVMSRRLLMGIALVPLVFATLAVGKAKKLDLEMTGGGPDAELKMKLEKSNRGVPKKMTGVKVSGLETDCEGIEGTVSHNFGNLKITHTTIPFNQYSFSATPEAGEEGLDYSISGASKLGRKWSGSVNGSFTIGGGMGCGTGNVGWEGK